MEKKIRYFYIENGKIEMTKSLRSSKPDFTVEFSEFGIRQIETLEPFIMRILRKFLAGNRKTS